MPIIYMHGVNTRDADHSEPVKEYLRRIVAPAISSKPETVSITTADWFQLCDPPKYGGISRPRTQLTGHGASARDTRDLVAEAIIEDVAETAPAPSGGLTGGQAPKPTVRLGRLTDAQLADLLTLTAPDERASAIERAKIGVAADSVARDAALRVELEKATSLDQQLRLLAKALDEAKTGTSPLAAAGAFDFLGSLKDHVGEALSRVADSPGAAASVAASELRPMLNDFVTRFLGDVLYYINLRGTAAKPGPIPLVLINALRAASDSEAHKAGEPIVLLTHSMGGQIAYDALTAFLPEVAPDIKIDFWCAAASQIGFFEELNMLLASSKAYSAEKENKVPVPSAHLRHWWNVWDHNDILSFTTKDIFADGIDDEEFWGGMAVVAAHGGYLARPSFYRKLHDKLVAALPGDGK